MKNLKSITYQTILVTLLVCLPAYAANQLTSSYSFTIVSDSEAPYVLSCLPEGDENNVPVHTNIQVCIKDDKSDIDSGTIDLVVEGTSIISDGSIQTYQNTVGEFVDYNVEIIEKTSSEYVVMFDPEDYFLYKQSIDVLVRADDELGNSLSSAEYTFKTQNFVYGQAKKLSGSTDNNLSLGTLVQDNADMATSNNGKDVHMVWEESLDAGIWSIYYALSSDFGETFSAPIKVKDVNLDQRHPVIAVDTNNNVFVVWQEKSLLGDWDIYVAQKESANSSFGTSGLVYSDGGAANQTAPAIATEAALTSDGNDNTVEPTTIYVAWVDENSGITSLNYTRTTAAYADAWNVFVITPIRVDDDRYPQSVNAPVIDVANNGKILIAWNGGNIDETNNLYFDYADKNIIDAGENFGTDSVLSNAAASAAGPALDISSNGLNLYIAWEQIIGANAEVTFSHYNESLGTYSLQSESQVNDSLLTDATLNGYDVQVDANGNAFVIWQQELFGIYSIVLAGASNQDYSFQEYSQFNTNANNNHPALAANQEGYHCYVGWADTQVLDKEMYLLRNTFFATDAIKSQTVDGDIGGQISVATGNLTGTIVTIPEDAIDAPTDITVAEVVAAPSSGDDIDLVDLAVDFGPGGTQFNTAATITIPYTASQLSNAGISSEENLKIYYYNLETLAWEEVAGSAVDVIAKTVSVSTLHFSMYGIGSGEESVVDDGDDGDADVVPPTSPAASSAASSGGGGGGGCFIATAAFGTKMAKEVQVLCDFRDTYLLTNSMGRNFVKMYYTYSPSIADYIAKRPQLRKIIRVSLKPLITLGKLICS